MIYNANGGTIKEEATFIDTGLVINGVYKVIEEAHSHQLYLPGLAAGGWKDARAAR